MRIFQNFRLKKNRHLTVAKIWGGGGGGALNPSLPKSSTAVGLWFEWFVGVPMGGGEGQRGQLPIAIVFFKGGGGGRFLSRIIIDHLKWKYR